MHDAGSTTILRGATLADGTVADVAVDAAAGTITSVVPAGGMTSAPAAQVVDLSGMLLVPSFVEPHAHLDKAFLAERVPNPTGDLVGAIEAMAAHAASITFDDVVERAERAARLIAANGATAIRTHADLNPETGLRNVLALLDVRDRLRDIVTIQVCALAGRPSIGPEGAEVRALLADAIAAGVDLIGGCPHLEPDAITANEAFLARAADARLPLDLHTDETLDAAVLGLEDLAQRVIASGFDLPVTASHCVSLGVQPEARQRAVAELVAQAGIAVVALPHTNLFLQGRAHRQSTPRGLTAVRALTDAGACVAAGADNLQDPFNPVGRGDPLETASLMIMAGHLLPHDALAAVSACGRTALSLPPVAVAAGSPADLVAVPAASPREAIAMGPCGRIVVRGGRIVAGQPHQMVPG